MVFKTVAGVIATVVFWGGFVAFLYLRFRRDAVLGVEPLCLGGAFVWACIFAFSVFGPKRDVPTDPGNDPLVIKVIGLLVVFLGTYLLCH